MKKITIKYKEDIIFTNEHSEDKVVQIEHLPINELALEQTGLWVNVPKPSGYFGFIPVESFHVSNLSSIEAISLLDEVKVSSFSTESLMDFVDPITSELMGEETIKSLLDTYLEGKEGCLSFYMIKGSLLKYEKNESGEWIRLNYKLKVRPYILQFLIEDKELLSNLSMEDNFNVKISDDSRYLGNFFELDGYTQYLDVALYWGGAFEKWEYTIVDNPKINNYRDRNTKGKHLKVYCECKILDDGEYYYYHRCETNLKL